MSCTQCQAIISAQLFTKKNFLGQWNLTFSIAFSAHAIKKDLHYLILLKEQRILSLFTYFQDTKNIW